MGVGILALNHARQSLRRLFIMTADQRGTGHGRSFSTKTVLYEKVPSEY